MSERSNDDLPRHPIAVVAARTGLSQDVLRVWERRYRAVIPERAAGGQRLYSDADIERLRMLNAATQAGRSIGQVAPLATSELARLVDEDVAAGAEHGGPEGDVQTDAGGFVDRAFEAVPAFDGRRLEDELRRAAAVLGIPTFVRMVASPLLERVGEGWREGRVTIAQEHFASSIVHDVVAAVLRGLVPPPGAARVLVATLSGERHTGGAVLAGVTAAAAGWEVVYLAGDVPADEIAGAAATAAARVVAVSVVYVADRDRGVADLRALRERLPGGVDLVVGGRGSAALGPGLADGRVGVTLEEFAAGLRRRAGPFGTGQDHGSAR